MVGDVVWSRKKQVRDRPTGMRLMDRSRELIPLQTHGEAYRKKGCMLYITRRCGWSSEGNERRRASAARRLNRDDVMQTWRLGGREDFVSK